MPQWLNIAFDCEIRDKRPVLQCEYDGLTLHIKPSAEEPFADVIAVFAHDPEVDDIQLRVNRFLSSMTWKDGKAYLTLGSGGWGTSFFEKSKPQFFYREKRQSPYGVITEYDFEHLHVSKDTHQNLGLALYRDALGVNNDFYRFLNFYKIINIRHARGKQQMEWINANISRLESSTSWTAPLGVERLEELQKHESDIGHYLYVQGRTAIAHAYMKPIRDPDIPKDRMTIAQDISLMRALAEMFIEQELGVPSIGTTWREHLYELSGFKSLFGDTLTQRLKSSEDVPMTDFPRIPLLSIGLKEKASYQALEKLKFEIRECRAGRVILVTDGGPESAQVVILLDFCQETLELAWETLGITRNHPNYSKAAEASIFRFLIDYFLNGSLQIINAETGERVSHKTAFIPVDINLEATIAGWRTQIKRLEEKSNKS